MPGRTFTPEEATSALPYVRRVVADMVRVYRRMRPRVTLYRRLSRASAPAARLERIRARIERLGRRLAELKGELDPVGCVLKDFERGLVDFPGILDGRPVELCWRLGEPAVAYWHEVGAGYFARQPLEPAPAAR